MSIGAGGTTVELDIAKIVAVVADALLRVGALPPRSALLSGGTRRATGRHLARLPRVRLAGGAEASLGRPDAAAGERRRAGPGALAVALPLRRATAVIENIAAHEDYVSIQLYGHPWVSGEYWPMITAVFPGAGGRRHGDRARGVRGSGGGAPEGSREFWFWPPVAPQAKRIRVIVSTLREAAWAEVPIPGRS